VGSAFQLELASNYACSTAWCKLCLANLLKTAVPWCRHVQIELRLSVRLRHRSPHALWAV